MKYKSEYETSVIFVALLVGGLITLAISGLASYFLSNQEEQVENNQWVGYCPIKVYTIDDKETGVYYAVTSKGGITPMYTIEGQVKLVDQGNEYVIHKNLGEPDAQVYD